MTEGRRYRVLGVLGRGGFGTVYRAELLGEGGFKRQVALKVLNPDMEGVTDVARRLRDEARVLGLLRHRSILQVDGLVRLDDRWTVVMEYVEGVDLGRFRGQPMPAGPALEAIGEVASALHVAYTWPSDSGEPLHLLHRDLKPTNILLTAAGEIKVLDFGIARAQFSGREAQTRSVLFGSPGYIAPERLDFEEGPAGDVYSVGVVLFEVLAGEPLGRALGRADKHQAMVDDGLGRLRRVGVPDDVVAFVDQLLQYEPEDRPTAREVESRCRQLRSPLGAPWLRDWAEEVVPPLLVNRGLGGDHDFSDSILMERSGLSGSDTMGFSADPVFPPSPERPAAGKPVPMPQLSLPTFDDSAVDEAGGTPASRGEPTRPPPPPPPVGAGVPPVPPPAPPPFVPDPAQTGSEAMAPPHGPSKPPPQQQQTSSAPPPPPAIPPAPSSRAASTISKLPSMRPKHLPAEEAPPELPAKPPPKPVAKSSGGVSAFTVVAAVFGIVGLPTLALLFFNFFFAFCCGILGSI